MKRQEYLREAKYSIERPVCLKDFLDICKAFVCSLNIDENNVMQEHNIRVFKAPKVNSYFISTLQLQRGLTLKLRMSYPILRAVVGGPPVRIVWAREELLHRRFGLRDMHSIEEELHTR